MRFKTFVALSALVVSGFIAMPAQAGWGVRIGVGVPLWYPGYGYPYGYPYYYRPYPVVVDGPPVVVQQAPVVQGAPVIQQATPAYKEPVPEVMPAPAGSVSAAQVSQYLSALADPSEQIRLDAVSQLGRLKAPSAVDPLDATLSGDSSPLVREAAARSLALIGSPRALPALRKAALADSDRDVRHSAQFAMDIIQGKS